MLAKNAKVGLVVSTTSNPVRPTTIPALSSPTTRGMPSRGTAASTGPANPTATTSASVGNPKSLISAHQDFHDTSRHGIGVFSSVR